MAPVPPPAPPVAGFERRCVMCQSLLLPHHPADTPVCHSLLCQAQYARIPKEGICRECGVPIPPLRHRQGVCEALACVHADSRRRLRHAREELAQVWQRARALTADAEAAWTPAKRQTAPDRTLAVVPYNTSGSRRAIRKRQRALESHIRTQLQESRQHTAEEIGQHRPQPAELPPELGPLFGSACAACRGHCCRGGGEHAYLNVRTMHEYRERHPDRTDDEILAAYLSHLPERSQVPGCVYQGSKGCTLPRDMRSAICNSHLCHGLKEVLTQHTNAGPVHALHILHREGTDVRYRRYAALPVLDPS